MKVILIEEERFAEICKLMQKAMDDLANDGTIAETHGISLRTLKFIAEEAHSRTHYIFVRWAQSHGASCVN